MERNEDRPSQDQLRSLFNDYLTGKRSAAPPPPVPPKARPPRPPEPARPAPRPKPAETGPANLNPGQQKRLRVMKNALPPPKVQRLLRLPELARDPAAFFARWDRLINGYGLKGASAVLLGELPPEEACAARLSQLLRCDLRDAKALAESPRWAGLPVERRAIAARDRLLQRAKRWQCPPELALRVELGRMSEAELAVDLLARKLRVDAAAARALAPKESADPVAQALDLAKRIIDEASRRRSALSEIVRERLAELKAEETLVQSTAEALGLLPQLAARLVSRPAVLALAPLERGARAREEARRVADELGCPMGDAARWLLGELPEAELEPYVGRAIAAALGVEPEAGLALARDPELAAIAAPERSKKAVLGVRALAEELRCAPAQAAALLGGGSGLASTLQGRLGLAEDAARALVEWTQTQAGSVAERVLAAVERVSETRAAHSCSADQAALLVSGRLSLSGLRAERLAAELAIAAELAGKLVRWMDAEKIGEAETKARIRNLRGWAAGTIEQACRMLLKEIPTPTKAGSDALPFSGAWE